MGRVTDRYKVRNTDPDPDLIFLDGRIQIWFDPNPVYIVKHPAKIWQSRSFLFVAILSKIYGSFSPKSVWEFFLQNTFFAILRFKKVPMTTKLERKEGVRP